MGHDFGAERGKKEERLPGQNKATYNSITRPHPERQAAELEAQ